MSYLFLKQVFHTDSVGVGGVVFVASNDECLLLLEGKHGQLVSILLLWRVRNSLQQCAEVIGQARGRIVGNE